MFRGLRGKLLLLAIIPAALATLAAAIGGLFSLRADQSSQQAAGLSRSASRAERSLQEQVQRMHAHAAGVAIRPAIADAVASSDRAALEPALLASFRALRDIDALVSVMEITDAAGKVLLRAHNPAQSGDDKSRLADVAAALAGTAKVGLERSPTSGQIAGGAVVPVRREGRVVGTLRVGFRLTASTATSLAAAAGTEVLLFSGETLAMSTVPEQRAEGVAAELVEAVRQGRQGQFEAVVEGRGTHRMQLLPLMDITGRGIGAVVLAAPTEPWEQARLSALRSMGGIALVVLLLAAAAAFVAAGRVAQPLSGMAAAMRRIAGGELDLGVPGLGRKDEVGDMAAALDAFREQSIEAQRLERAAAAERALKERRTQAMERYIADFNQSVAGVMATMEQSALTMQQAANAMAETASTTEQQAVATEQGAVQSCTDLAAVAAATEELNVSVSEITRQVTQAADVTREAVALAAGTDTQVRDLTHCAERIGDVVRLITDIAGQTNLLALNATIEAARAGESGKGFAVVAGEVKNLATQTAKATGDIAAQIEAMRHATEGVVGAMQSISMAISRMDEAAAGIAAAVEEQGAATRDISGSIQMVSESTQRAVSTMQALTAAANEAGKASNAVLSTAGQVREQSGNLKREVEGFVQALQSDTGERRRYERIATPGQSAMLAGAGGAERRVVLRDISLGGAAVECDAPLQSGAAVNLQVGPDKLRIAGRVVRQSQGVLAVVFQQEPGAREGVERYLATLRSASRKAA